MDRKKGEKLVRMSRYIVEEYLKGNIPDITKFVEDWMKEKKGTFVTLKKGGELRGCMGVPLPLYPLYLSLYRSSLMAAFEDPRFPPLTREELDTVTFEVSVLTEPKPSLWKDVTIGRDGIIVEGYGKSGLLLPQVPIEEGMSRDEFLRAGCIKAGLWPECYKDKNVKIYTFQSYVFSELLPRGAVVRVL